MAQIRISAKRLQINKANSMIVGFIAGAAFVTVFSLVASKALWSKYSFQHRVISAKERAKTQLNANISAVNDLVASYQDFVSTPKNVLNGDPQGKGDKDGDNAKIVLDALPSKYDFPALTSSLEKLLSGKNYTINSITGTDDEVNQDTTNSNPNPTPVTMPFQIGVTGTYTDLQSLVGTLEKSIRPFQIQTLTFSGNDTSLQLTIAAQTYYQPAKSLNITTKEIK